MFWGKPAAILWGVSKNLWETYKVRDWHLPKTLSMNLETKPPSPDNSMPSYSLIAASWVTLMKGIKEDTDGKEFRVYGLQEFILLKYPYYPSSVQFNCSVVSNSLRPHESQCTRPPCPSPSPRVYSNSCPLSQWWHPAISSSVVPFSSNPQSLPASGSFPMSQLFSWGGQSIGVLASASVLAI